MQLTRERTVAELVAESPSRARVFEKHGIDYCCGGGRPLGEACQERGLAVTDLLAELEAAAPAESATDWTAAGLSDLARHIVSTHHARLRSELPRLRGLLAKVIEAHAENHGEALKRLGAVVEALAAELTSHMEKEEVVLFPLVESMEAAEKTGSGLPASACGSIENPLRVMRQEHDQAADALREMSRLANGYAPPEDACNTFRVLYAGLKELEEDLHMHIHLENNILFPRASELESRLSGR